MRHYPQPNSVIIIPEEKTAKVFPLSSQTVTRTANIPPPFDSSPHCLHLLGRMPITFLPQSKKKIQRKLCLCRTSDQRWRYSLSALSRNGQIAQTYQYDWQQKLSSRTNKGGTNKSMAQPTPKSIKSNDFHKKSTSNFQN